MNRKFFSAELQELAEIAAAVGATMTMPPEPVIVDPHDLTPEVDGDELQSYLETKFGKDQTGGQAANSDDDDTIDDDDNDVDSADDRDDDAGGVSDSADGEEDEEDSSGGQGLTYEVTLPDGSTATLTSDQLIAFHEFNNRLKADPKLQYWLSAYNPDLVPTPGAHVGEDQPTAPGPSPQPVEDTIPEDVDLDDPTVKYLYEQNKKLEADLAALKGITTQTYEQQAAQQRQAVEGLITTARTTFAEQYKLSEDDSQKILDVAGRMGAAQTYMNGIDPRTGLPVTNPNPIEAVTVAMEMAMWALPEFRTKAIKDEVKTARSDRVRKGKLTAISGNSGSASRSTPAPKNEAERRAAMIAEVAADMGHG